jgi:gluconolactonase
MNPLRSPRLLILLPILAVPLACTSKHSHEATSAKAAERQIDPTVDVMLTNDTNPPKVAVNAVGTLGTIERLDPKLDALLAPDAKLEILVDGVDWCEGPVWFNGAVHFSDVKQNTNYRWSPNGGVRPYMKPSGYSSPTPRGGEPGSNGMTVDPQNHLVLCQHGDRRVARLEKDGKTITPLADRYQGKRFNSPNDLCFDSKGNLYFTDPPYGMVDRNDSEMKFNGVYLLRASGELVRTPIDLKYPNGIALSPDGRWLYVAVSDPENPVVMKYAVQDDANVDNRGVLFFSAKDLVAKKLPGLPDGMKFDTQGNLWLGGPGGILIISAEGKHLGTIKTGVPTANCAWGDADGSTLYVCANHNLCRIKTKARGILPGAR